MYTYDIQYVDFPVDQVKEMGQVTAEEAVKIFQSFPFKEQQEKAKTLTEPTFPTISFRSRNDGANLAVWSLEPNVYEVYFENNGKKVTAETNEKRIVIESIESFFAGNRSDLYDRLSKIPGAVTPGHLFNRIKSIFWS